MYNYISEENGLSPRLSEIENDLCKISNFSEELTKLSDRISSVRIEVQDLEIERSSPSILSHSIGLKTMLRKHEIGIVDPYSAIDSNSVP